MTKVQSMSALGAAALVLLLQACGGSNDPSNSNPGTAGSSSTGTAGTTGNAGTSGTAGTTGTGGSASTGTGGTGLYSPSCTGLTTAASAEPTKGGACVAADPQLCYKTCGPEKAGAKSETCTGGVYAEMSG